ncbi:TPA: hypothetical protein DCX16_01895 [bacterium]|nr:hypothetical protein [bacterium]
MLDKLADKLEKSWEQLAVIREIDRASLNLNIDELYKIGLSCSMRLLGVEKGFLAILEKDRSYIHLGEGIDNNKIGLFIPRQGFIKEIIERKRLFWNNDIVGEPFKGMGISSVLAIPLVVYGRDISAIIILCNKNDGFTIDDARLLEPIISHLAYVVQTIKLAEELRLADELQKVSARAAHKIGTRIAALDTPRFILKKELSGSDLENEVDFLKEEIEKTREMLREFTSLTTPFELKIQKIDLESIIRKTVCLDGIEVDIDIPKGILIEGDLVRLEDVFLELSLNAKKAMNGKGKISVRAEEMEDFIRIEFKDTGPGIPDEDKTRIFEPFFGRTGSTGLGLSIVKHIIGLHHGSIEEIGAPGKGANFIISLPIKQKKEV